MAYNAQISVGVIALFSGVSVIGTALKNQWDSYFDVPSHFGFVLNYKFRIRVQYYNDNI